MKISKVANLQGGLFLNTFNQEIIIRERGGLQIIQPAQQAFLCGLGAKNEERESKTARQMAQVKESVIFWLSFHFSRGQNRESHSSVFLCSETARKRLIRRLQIIPLRYLDVKSYFQKLRGNRTIQPSQSPSTSPLHLGSLLSICSLRLGLAQ